MKRFFGIAAVIALVMWSIPANSQNAAASKQPAGAQYEEGLALLKADKPEEARMKFEEASTQGNTDAMNELGKLYLLGQGVARDAVQAQKLFQQSADGGDARGKTNLGLMYLGDRGIPADLEKALHLFVDASDQGEPIASYQIALYYENGKGMKKDHAKAMQWFIKAAQEGSKEAQILVGDSYRRGDAPGGVSRDVNAAATWYKKAIEGRDPQIVAQIAVRMLELNTPQFFDPKTGIALLSESARAGNALGQYHLAMSYKKGYSSLLDKDTVKAAGLFKASAEQGFGLALDELAGLYLSGEGVEKNALNAYVSAALAVNRGAPWASSTRDKAAAELPPAQLEGAKTEIERRKAAWK